MSQLKPKLLRLSEEIVDLSDTLDQLDFDEDAKQKSETHQRLLEIGDKLVEYLDQADGDDKAYIYFSLGSVCSILGYWEKAEKAYDQALDYWPDHVGILNEAFDVLVQLGKHDKAIRYIEASMKHGGETPDVLFNYASILGHSGKTDRARIVLINALAKFPDDKGCRALLEEIELMIQQSTKS